MQHEIFTNISSFVYNINSSLRSASNPPHIIIQSEESISKLKCKDSSSNNKIGPILLVQHKPEHLEQLILRISNTPHTIQNSFYMVNECTGPYPCLVDLTHGALIGRNHPHPSSPSKVSDYNDCQNDIIAYLRIAHDINLDKSINDPIKSSQRSFIQTLLHRKLHPILLFLQTRSSNNKLDQVKNIFLTPFDAFQSFAMYHSTCRSIPSFIQNEDMAVKMAKDAYLCLNTVLQQSIDNTNDPNTKITLLQTEEYTNIDCLLYAHICEALLQPPLFFLLKSCTNILSFYKAIRSTYFENNKDDWKIQNDAINQQNQYYNHLPLSLFDTSTEEEQKNRDLDAIVQSAFEAKRKRNYTIGKSFQNLCFYQSLHVPDQEEVVWSFASKKNQKDEKSGGKGKTGFEESSKEGLKRMQQARQHQDMLWLGGMLGIISFAYYLG